MPNAWFPRNTRGTTRADRAPSTLRVGDVARMLNEPTHVLRYWEDEFAKWLPIERHRGQRLYSPRMLENLREIQRLLRVELYTIEGAKRQLRLAAEAMPRSEQESA